MYTELLPPVREAATWYRSQISKDERPEPDPVMLGRLTDHVWELEHVSVMTESVSTKNCWRARITGGIPSPEERNGWLTEIGFERWSRGSTMMLLPLRLDFGRRSTDRQATI
jgi:hypothetical protein